MYVLDLELIKRPILINPFYPPNFAQVNYLRKSNLIKDLKKFPFFQDFISLPLFEVNRASKEFLKVTPPSKFQ